jgi:acyl carrier protein
MDHATLKQAVDRILIDQWNGEYPEIRAEWVFGEDIQVDSLDLVEIAMTLESAFGIAIEDDELALAKTPALLYQLVLDKLQLT